MRTSDILEIQNLMGRYLDSLIAGRWDVIRTLFSRDPEAAYQINPTRIPIVGPENVHEKGFGSLDAAFPDYDSFHTGGQITVPLIEVSPDGLRAWAMLPSFGFLVLGKVFGNTEPPFPVCASFGMWAPELIKEEGRWKIFQLRAPTLFEQTVWMWDPRKCRGYGGQSRIRSLPPPPEPYED